MLHQVTQYCSSAGRRLFLIHLSFLSIFILYTSSSVFTLYQGSMLQRETVFGFFCTEQLKMLWILNISTDVAVYSWWFLSFSLSEDSPDPHTDLMVIHLYCGLKKYSTDKWSTELQHLEEAAAEPQRKHRHAESRAAAWCAAWTLVHYLQHEHRKLPLSY